MVVYLCVSIMAKTLPLILTVLGSCVLSEALRCCKCSNGKTIGVSYRECKNNNTCEWTCPNRVVPPYVIDFSIDTEDHKAYLGTTFNLSCTVNFGPAIVNSIPHIVFLRHGSSVWDVPGKYETFHRAVVNGALITSKLSLKNVTKAEGSWSCFGIQRSIKGDYKEINVDIDPCPAGYYCLWNESRKHECPYGTYSDGSTNVTYQCTKCPGEYLASKPKGYSGPAKSIQECPVKVSVSERLPPGPKTPLIIGIVAVFSLLVFLLLVVIKFRKQCKQGFRKIISVNNLISEPELVINDFCSTNDSTNLLTNVPNVQDSTQLPKPAVILILSGPSRNVQSKEEA